MKRLVALILVTTLLASSGCADSHRGPSTGGGGRPAGTNGPGPQRPPLPVPKRDPLGYDHSRTTVNAVAGGQVDALAPSPSSTSTLAGHAPLDRVTPVSPAAVAGAPEVTFPAPATSLATVGAFVFAATGDLSINGAGDVYRRVETTPGAPTWSRIVDTGATVAVVGSLATHAVAAVGGPGLPASLLLIEPSAPAVVSSASLGDVLPTALSELPAASGMIYIGYTADVGGVPTAGLLRSRAGAVELLALTTVQAQATVTALLRVPTATAGVDALVVAVATFDPLTGAPLSGEVLLSDGLTFTTILQLTGDAPTCLAFADDTLQAGTATGRLLWLDAGGTWNDEPGFAAVERVTSLLARDGRTLVVAGRTAGGAVVAVRTRRSP